MEVLANEGYVVLKGVGDVVKEYEVKDYPYRMTRVGMKVMIGDMSLVKDIGYIKAGYFITNDTNIYGFYKKMEISMENPDKQVNTSGVSEGG